MTTDRITVVAAIGATQTIAWASSYYLPAILGAPIAAGLQLPTTVFFGLFSAALLLSAIIGPSVGRLIDRHGGRSVLAVSNLVLGAGLIILAAAHGVAGLAVAWMVLAVGMAMGLYDPAFAALTCLYGRDARSSITGITLIAGFASTIGWPLSAMFLHAWGWRAACLAWGGINLLLAAPLNWLTIPRDGTSAALPQPVIEPETPEPPRAAMPILAFFFAATWFVQGAMAAHLPGLLRAAGAASTAAIAAAALVGPAQVGARIVEFCLLRSFHPLVSARIASALHPMAAASLMLFGAPGIVAFALLHGAGNGMITIAKGTLPLALFGPRGYGLRSGTLSVSARMLQSAAPFLFGLLLDRVGIAAVGLSAGLCLAAFGSLLMLRAHPAGADASPAGGYTKTADDGGTTIPSNGMVVNPGHRERQRSTFAS
jgi:MFS family permease